MLDTRGDKKIIEVTMGNVFIQQLYLCREILESFKERGKRHER